MRLLKRKNGPPSKFWKIFPRPVPESVALDLLYIGELLLLQDYIIPQFFAHKVFVDLLTPWMLIVFVFRAPWRMFLLASFAVLLLETHSGLPSGLYICLYWILGVTLYYARHNISWASFLPWGAVFLLSQVLMMGLEGVSYWTQNYSSFRYIASSFSHNFFNGLLSCLFGLFVVYKARLDTLEEQRLARH